jgi:hypothetical protein
LARLLFNDWWVLIVTVDDEVLVLIINSWRVLLVKVDEAVLVLICLAVGVRLFFLCDMLRR